MAAPTVSVVINTVDRFDGLRATLRALRHQRHSDFEVIVVEGPSRSPYDLTGEVGVRHLHCDRRNLPASRNIGLAAAAGELVAFIDDDAIPEPRWLTALAAAYATPRVGGAGGVVYDHTGTRMQYRYSRCDRLGHARYSDQPVSDAEQSPGAEVFPYLQGTNMSFRRDLLAAIGGFDETIDYVFDDVDTSLRVVESGAVLRCIDGAAVYHKYLPSRVRNAARVITDPYLTVKDRASFALLNGPATHTTEQVLGSLVAHVAEQRTMADDLLRAGRFTQDEFAFFNARLDEGLRAGVLSGMRGRQGRGEVADPPSATFVTYPRLLPGGGARLTVCVLARELPAAGSELRQVARDLGARGHEVHVIARAGEELATLDFEEDCWVHRVPDLDKRLPGLSGAPGARDLYRATADWLDVAAIDGAQPVDLVLAGGDGFCCALDPELFTVAVTGSGRGPLEEQACERADRRAPPGGVAAVVTKAVAERAAGSRGRSTPVKTMRQAADHLAARADALAPGLAPIVGDIASTDPETAVATARRLLDPANHPVDVRAAVGAAWTASTREFLTMLSRALLRRELRPGELEQWEPEVEHRGWRRSVVVIFASSPEARSLGVDAAWLRSLRDGSWPLDHRELARRLGALSGADDDRFLADAGELVLERPLDAAEHAHGLERLASGATGLDLVSWLAALPAARVRDVRGRALLAALGETLDVLLRRAWMLDDTAFVRRVHEIVLEREVEDELLGSWSAQLSAGGGRLDHLRLVASSAEARTLAAQERALTAGQPSPGEPESDVTEAWYAAIESDPPPDPRPGLLRRTAGRARRRG